MCLISTIMKIPTNNLFFRVFRSFSHNRFYNHFLMNFLYFTMIEVSFLVQKNVVMWINLKCLLWKLLDIEPINWNFDRVLCFRPLTFRVIKIFKNVLITCHKTNYRHICRQLMTNITRLQVYHFNFLLFYIIS